MHNTSRILNRASRADQNKNIARGTGSVTQQAEQPAISYTHAHGRDRRVMTRNSNTEAQQFPYL
jgi:hypothetical protein